MKESSECKRPKQSERKRLQPAENTYPSQRAPQSPQYPPYPQNRQRQLTGRTNQHLPLSRAAQLSLIINLGPPPVRGGQHARVDGPREECRSRNGRRECASRHCAEVVIVQVVVVRVRVQVIINNIGIGIGIGIFVRIVREGPTTRSGLFDGDGCEKDEGVRGGGDRDATGALGTRKGLYVLGTLEDAIRGVEVAECLSGPRNVALLSYRTGREVPAEFEFELR
jgi:hypothetical protein